MTALIAASAATYFGFSVLGGQWWSGTFLAFWLALITGPIALVSGIRNAPSFEIQDRVLHGVGLVLAVVAVVAVVIGALPFLALILGGW